MAGPTGITITEIHNAKTGAKNTDEEWIVIKNDGTTRWTFRGFEVTDETATQQRVHVYHFPDLINGGRWTFDPGESIYVFTGVGTDAFHANPGQGRRPQFHFFMNRRAMVWNNTGDRVYVRHPDGTFVTQPFAVP